MILRFLALFIFCSSFVNDKPGRDLIPWNMSSRLTWGNFKAAPPANAYNAALTSSSISLDYRTDGQSLTYTIGCHFDQSQSWGRVKNELILAHEQGHFDISEIYARRLNKAMNQYRYNSSNAGKDVGAIYQRIMQELQQRQNDYDEETDHSRNAAVQKKWLLVIEDELTGLEKYAGYGKLPEP